MVGYSASICFFIDFIFSFHIIAIFLLRMHFLNETIYLCKFSCISQDYLFLIRTQLSYVDSVCCTSYYLILHLPFSSGDVLYAFCTKIETNTISISIRRLMIAAHIYGKLNNRFQIDRGT